MSDEQVLRALPDDADVPMSEQQRSAIDNVLARLSAAEKVAEMVGENLPPKRKPGDKLSQAHWWDVAIAVQEWEKVRAGAGARTEASESSAGEGS